MAADVVPVLNERIQTDFKSNVMKDRRIAQVSKKIEEGTATFVDVHQYAERLGENLSKALMTNLNEETLPDGKLYYNIAKRTVTPALEETYNLTNEVAADVQAIQDKKSKIGLNTVKADFPEERIQGLIDKMTSEGQSLNDAKKWLGEPIVNNSEAFVDDFIDANAKMRSEVGLKATITRIAENGCCEWCASLAGTYDYGAAPPEIYQRHEFCRCTVTYQSGKKSQNVWSKKTWQSTPEEIQKRKDVGKTIIKDTELEAKDLLLDSYENQRIKSGMDLTPRSELGTDINDIKSVGADYSKTDIKMAEAFNESLENINKKYVTTIQYIEPMSSIEAMNSHSVYARTSHDYRVADTSKIQYNPIKIGNSGKLSDKISELKEKGFIPKIDDENILKYIPTHELGHTIIDMNTPLPQKNLVGGNHSNVKAARKEISKLFNEYTDNYSSKKNEVGKLLDDFLNLDDEGLKRLTIAEENYEKSLISQYSLTNADEFIAEAYADATLSNNPNPWSLKLTGILDKYFGL